MNPQSVTPRGLAFRLVAPVLGAVLALSLPAVAQGPPSPVRVSEVREELVQDRRLVTGDLRAVRRAEVATREKGLVLELLVREGQVVERGTVLARLDAEILELDRNVLQAQRGPVEASARERKSALEQAERDLQSLRTLAGREATNPKELADAETERIAAEARWKASLAELEVISSRVAQLNRRIENKTILAPFGGTVTARRTERGAWLGEGATVVELLSSKDLEVWLEVPQEHLPILSRGAGPIEALVGANGESLILQNYHVIPDIDRKMRTFRLVAPVDSALTLAAGMSVTAFVPKGELKKFKTVPRDAILRNSVGSFVYAVVPGSEDQPPKAAPTQVRVLFQTRQRSVIEAPSLRAGTQVVVEGNERLYPMAPIAPIPTPDPAPDQASPEDDQKPAQDTPR